MNQIPLSQLFWSFPVFGALFLVLSRVFSSINQGEIHVVMSASWQGMWGQVIRNDRPILFWIVVSAHAAWIIKIGVLFLKQIWS